MAPAEAKARTEATLVDVSMATLRSDKVVATKRKF
jgi:hypothetical protein